MNSGSRKLRKRLALDRLRMQIRKDHPHWNAHGVAEEAKRQLKAEEDRKPQDDDVDAWKGYLDSIGLGVFSGQERKKRKTNVSRKSPRRKNVVTGCPNKTR